MLYRKQVGTTINMGDYDKLSRLQLLEHVVQVANAYLFYHTLLAKIYRVILVITGFFFIVARSQSDSDSDAELVAETIKEGVDVGRDAQDFGLGNFTPAPDVETLLVVAGQETELLIGMKNMGKQSVNVLAVHASVHLPFDHRMLVQNLSVVVMYLTILEFKSPFGFIDESLTPIYALWGKDGSSSMCYWVSMVAPVLVTGVIPLAPVVSDLATVRHQSFNNASVPASVQATFPYIFAVSKFLQPGIFDLVGTITYEIDQQPYQNTFYNSTIEVTEAGGFVSAETVLGYTWTCSYCASWLVGSLSTRISFQENQEDKRRWKLELELLMHQWTND
ncbi:hypothetical protein E3N88_02063 [Mikania micrantha]|uniref:Uncharacterized protein n=1 Tax=Mikania micrantha TaxID=192012 RepID=A0A5N6Q4N4_9ASTR|nr:hypothetical protein E3N88_02063 [Mikania micrantha]